MKKTKTDEFEHFDMLLKEIEKKTFDHLIGLMKTLMPPQHVNHGTLFAIALGLSTRTICTLCENDQEAKNRALAHFNKELSKMVIEARVFWPSTLDDIQQVH